MLRDDVVEKFYIRVSDKGIPINIIVTCTDAMEYVLEEIRREEPYAELSRLFYE